MFTNPLQTTGNRIGRRTSQSPERVDFSKIKTAARIPNLIEVQKESYNRFLQMDLLPEERDHVGLQAVLSSVFPISDFRIPNRQLAVQMWAARRFRVFARQL
jgi:DNA-directed RNA polymerase subunit beta